LQASSYNPYPTSLATKARKLAGVVLNGVNMVLRFILSIPSRLRGFAALTSAQRREVYKGWWLTIKKEANHYWVPPPPPPSPKVQVPEFPELMSYSDDRIGVVSTG
jgi:hypothetical protein